MIARRIELSCFPLRRISLSGKVCSSSSEERAPEKQSCTSSVACARVLYGRLSLDEYIAPLNGVYTWAGSAEDGGRTQLTTEMM